MDREESRIHPFFAENLYLLRGIMLEIRQTSKDDLKNIQKLWAEKEVMAHVGIPEGLKEANDDMDNWLYSVVSNRPKSNHYSIYNDDKFCGEVHYNIDTIHCTIAELGIKLYSFARGKGIASDALNYVIKEAYKNEAKIIFVNPNPKNKRAIRFYEKFGFDHKATPDFIDKKYPGFDHYYMELKK